MHGVSNGREGREGGRDRKGISGKKAETKTSPRKSRRRPGAVSSLHPGCSLAHRKYCVNAGKRALPHPSQVPEGKVPKHLVLFQTRRLSRQAFKTETDFEKEERLEK